MSDTKAKRTEQNKKAASTLKTYLCQVTEYRGESEHSTSILVDAKDEYRAKRLLICEILFEWWNSDSDEDGAETREMIGDEKGWEFAYSGSVTGYVDREIPKSHVKILKQYLTSY